MREDSVPNPVPPRSSCAFAEFAQRHGDYALVGVAAMVALDESGACSQARLVFLSVGKGPVEAEQAQKSLLGRRPNPITFAKQPSQLATSRDIDPHGDIHASPAYRRHLARVLSGRALKQAFQMVAR